ncbi:MAG: alpha-amylase family glycosyl hydrolase [Bacillota bacterium]|nr:alpha-amylase family glycosyl hydrolase [Bacillota bacterium]
MAVDTLKRLRNMVIYSVFVRNYGKNGTFSDVEKDLERIKGLGVDIICFLPVYPVGETNRKGTLGSPYSIRNHRGINPEYGSPDDFRRLIDKIHKLDMRVMIDIVFCHTSPDSDLLKKHPEFFYRKPDGKLGSRVGDARDIIDLDYSSKELWKEQIDTMKYWISFGADGFRCDTASLIPIKFWKEAREEIRKVKPEVVWLAENIEPDSITEFRKRGFNAGSDSELFNVFDMCCDYDVHRYLLGYLEGTNSLKEYITRAAQQEYIFPENYVKLRFLENQDRPRAAGVIRNRDKLKTWTAYLFFQKGAVLIYNGQEAMEDHTQSLYEHDKIVWEETDEEFTKLFKSLSALKKQPIMAEGNYSIGVYDDMDIIVITYDMDGEKLMGIFNVGLEKGEIKLPIADGNYDNLAVGGATAVEDGTLILTDNPIIIKL